MVEGNIAALGPDGHPLGALRHLGGTMVRERAPEKAVRLLGEGKVRIRAVSVDEVLAIVEGDHDTYRVTRHEGRWFCDCPAMGPCSHGMAAAKVVG